MLSPPTVGWGWLGEGGGLTALRFWGPQDTRAVTSRHLTYLQKAHSHHIPPPRGTLHRAQGLLPSQLHREPGALPAHTGDYEGEGREGRETGLGRWLGIAHCSSSLGVKSVGVSPEEGAATLKAAHSIGSGKPTDPTAEAQTRGQMRGLTHILRLPKSEQ